MKWPKFSSLNTKNLFVSVQTLWLECPDTDNVKYQLLTLRNWR